MLYYGVGTGSITVTATLTDNLAGLDTVAFPAAAGLGASYAQNGVRNATAAHVYSFDAAATFRGTVSIQAADRAGNTITSNVVLIHDRLAPTITLTANAQGLTLSTNWAASDADAGLKSCVLELVMSGQVTSLSTSCSGQVDVPVTQEGGYLVRFTAWDNVSNRVVQEQSATVSSVTNDYNLGSQRITQRCWICTHTPTTGGSSG